MTTILKKIFGDTSTRELKGIDHLVRNIEDLANEYAALSDITLQAKTIYFKERLAKGETLDDLLPEAFAAMREACRRVLGQFPFRVQLIGGIVLHQGNIAEMRTGEGKTLTSTLPAYLNALSGKGVHIVTVNDYLAKYQGELMRKVFQFMGLSCGIIVQGMTQEQKRAAYATDVTYCTNNELGFDYLRDNMAVRISDIVQRGHQFAIVDEVDSILIDEARTPLIISRHGDAFTKLYEEVDQFVRTLKGIRVMEVDPSEDQENLAADYLVDEKARIATITPRGIMKAERYFNCGNIADQGNTSLLHHINQAIRAHGCMKRDVDYLVRDGEILIVDEGTGRLMYGRRYSDGLHQAIEAKEGVSVKRESKTLATITFQNYFRMYEKLSGMTGTGMTEEEEFRTIYGLNVIEIPTNRPVQRIDHADLVFRTEAGKQKALIRKIQECYARQQPVLIGTASIEKSEELSRLLKKEGIPHQVLNAKEHEKEAGIVAQAGRSSSVTIATNMAGRGTDIMLGGNAEYMAKEDLMREGFSPEVITEACGFNDTTNMEVLQVRSLFNIQLQEHKKKTEADRELVRAAGGLCILGTERHESRRIDNQLRGRAGRQGDPGESTFYLSMEDDLMRIFGTERVKNVIESLGIPEDEPIDHKLLSGAIESAQKQIEGRNFQSRKTVLEYDDVLNQQRKIIFAQRMDVLAGKDLQDYIRNMISEIIQRSVHDVSGDELQLGKIAAQQLATRYTNIFVKPEQAPLFANQLQGLSQSDAILYLENRAAMVYAAKETSLSPPLMRDLERKALLRAVDQKWIEHVNAMRELRQGIGLQAYAQIDPKIEYTKQGFELFDQMVKEIREETVRLIFVASVAIRNQTVHK